MERGWDGMGDPIMPSMLLLYSGPSQLCHRPPRPTPQFALQTTHFSHNSATLGGGSETRTNSPPAPPRRLCPTSRRSIHR